MSQFVQSFDRKASRTIAFAQSIFSYILLIGIGLVTFEVICRYFFNASHDYADEGIVHVLLFAMFGGAATALEDNRHINMELVADHLTGRANRINQLVILTLVLISCVIMAYFSWMYMLFLIKAEAASETTVPIPYYLGPLALLIGMILTSLSALRKILVLASGQAEPEKGGHIPK